MLIRMDEVLDRLVTGLNNVGLLDCVNLVIVSDHGMAACGPSWVIKLEDYIPNLSNEAKTFTGTFTRINPKDKSNGKK